MAASRPFSAEMDSAKRQFMGMLGWGVPVKEMGWAHSWISFGRVGAIRGFWRIPVSKIWRVESGMEYEAAVPFATAPLVVMVGCKRFGVREEVGYRFPLKFHGFLYVSQVHFR